VRDAKGEERGEIGDQCVVSGSPSAWAQWTTIAQSCGGHWSSPSSAGGSVGIDPPWPW
jgi:hypothetical protein